MQHNYLQTSTYMFNCHPLCCRWRTASDVWSRTFLFEKLKPFIFSASIEKNQFLIFVLKQSIRLSYALNTTAADVLATQGVRVSAAMVWTYLSYKMWFSPPEELKSHETQANGWQPQFLCTTIFRGHYLQGTPTRRPASGPWGSSVQCLPGDLTYISVTSLSCGALWKIPLWQSVKYQKTAVSIFW